MACFPHSRQYGRCLSLTSFWSSGARRFLSFIGNLFKILEEFLGTSQPWIIHFFRPNSSVLGELFSIKFFECFISQRDTASHISLLTFPSCMQGAACVFRILKYLTLIVSFFFCARPSGVFLTYYFSLSIKFNGEKERYCCFAFR